MSLSRFLPAAALAALGLAAAPAAVSAADFPTKPIRLVVAYAAGGSVDVLARMLAKHMSEDLGQPVVVENRPGAGGGVAATAIARAEPDGYTLLTTTSTSMTFDPHVNPVDYALDSFVYLRALAAFQEAFVALPDRPYQTFEALIEHARDRPLNYGSSNPLDKVVAAFVARQSGAGLIPVPMGGGADVMTAVLGGHVDFGYSAGIHASHVEAGNMVVLASMGDDRLVAAPEVPTLKELGFDIASVNLNVVAAPKGVPQAVLERLDAALGKAAAHPEFKALVEQRRLGPVDYGLDTLGDVLREHSETYEKALADG
jgi:tripartite-type tricarboxylate transporter receptor subunit TctC